MTISIIALEVVFALLVILAGLLLYKASRSSAYRFNLEDLLLDRGTGKASLGKLGQLTALCVSTWLIVYLAIGGHLTEFYFGTYMTAWVAANVTNKVVDQRNKNAELPSTI